MCFDAFCGSESLITNVYQTKVRDFKYQVYAPFSPALGTGHFAVSRAEHAVFYAKAHLAGIVADLASMVHDLFSSSLEIWDTNGIPFSIKVLIHLVSFDPECYTDAQWVVVC